MLPELQRVFSALNEEVRYCGLRGVDELHGPAATSRDIDLLVDSESVSTIEKICRVNGFFSLSDPSSRPHFYFVAYLAREDVWLKLDVVTELSFGTSVKFLSMPGGDILNRRIFNGEIFSASPRDEFLLLLLHCILDKRGFSIGHRERLTVLARTFQSDGTDGWIELVAEFCEAAIPRNQLHSLIEMVLESKWHELLAMHSSIRNRMVIRTPAQCISRYAQRRIIGRITTPFVRAIRHNGIIIALLSPDGGGKTTLACTLSNDIYIHAHKVYLGLYPNSSSSGTPASQHRSRENPWLRLRTFRRLRTAANHWIKLVSAILHWVRGKNVVFDRYIYDILIAPKPISFYQRLRHWLLTAGWPKPDLVLMLDAPGEILFNRKREHTAEYLESQRQKYLELSPQIPNFVRIDATLSAEDVARQARSVVWARSFARY